MTAWRFSPYLMVDLRYKIIVSDTQIPSKYNRKKLACDAILVKIKAIFSSGTYAPSPRFNSPCGGFNIFFFEIIHSKSADIWTKYLKKMARG